MAKNDMPLLGEINTWQAPVAPKRLDPDADTGYLIQEVVTERYIYDAIGKGPYKGVVLRVEDSFGLNGNDYDHPEDHPEGYLYNKRAGAGAAPLYRIRVRIPEVHAALPMPRCLPTAGAKEAHPEDGIINLYPVFVSEKPNLEEPKQGMLVWVDFRDKDNFEKPIYKGAVDGAATLQLACGESETPAQNSFNRSRDCVGLAVTAPAGASFGTSCVKASVVDSEGVRRTTYYGEPSHDHSGIVVEEEAVNQMPSATSPEKCVEEGTAGTPGTMEDVNGNGTETEDGGLVNEDLDKWDIVCATLVGETGVNTKDSVHLHHKRCVAWTIRNRMKNLSGIGGDRARKSDDGTLIRQKYDASSDPRGVCLKYAAYSLWNSMNRGGDFVSGTDPSFGGRSNKPENRKGPHFGRGENHRALAQSDIVRHAKEWVESRNTGGWQSLISMIKEIIPDGGSDEHWSAVVPDKDSPFQLGGTWQPVRNYYAPYSDPSWGYWEKRDGTKTYKDKDGNTKPAGPANRTDGNWYGNVAPTDKVAQRNDDGHNSDWVTVPVDGQSVYEGHRFGLTRRSQFRAA